MAPASESPSVPAPTVSSTASTNSSSVPFWQQPDFWPDVQRRARQKVLPLAGVAAVGFIDFQFNDQIIISLLIVLAGAALTLFFGEAVAAVTAKLNRPGSSNLVAPGIISSVAGLLFALRGRGGSAGGEGLELFDGLLIGVIIAVLPLALSMAIPKLAPTLGSFFQLRDRYIPEKARPAAAGVLAIVVSYGLIHGSLFDFQVLWGGDADKAEFSKMGKIALTAILTGVIGMLMMSPAPDPLPSSTESAT